MFYIGLLICIGLLVLFLFIWLFVLRHSYRKLTNGRPWQWLRSHYGMGRSVMYLARMLEINACRLREVAMTYKTVHVAKKRGGQRKLLIPNDKLKKIQRLILRRVLQKLRSHPAATGFEESSSMVHNALPHAGGRVIIKLDVIDFFPSTRAERVEAYLRRVGWNADAAKLLTQLCTHKGGLPQGAPTSPRLSNLVNYQFDWRLQRFVHRRNGAYTRYADDITISFPSDCPRRIRGTIQFVRRLAKAHGYTIHTRQKLRILRPHQQQRVTGLVVNEKVQLPRQKRRRLRAIAHHLRTGRPATLSAAQMEGWAGLMNMIHKQSGGVKT